MIWVGTERDQATARLCYPARENWSDSEKFAALSHCWGGSSPFMLTLENHDRLLDGINLELLPKTFRDAIKITKELGISYLWIDSLCIIQNSEEDWERECVKMVDVYANAAVTICASDSTDSSGGCFRVRDPLEYYPLHLIYDSDRILTIKMEDRDIDSILNLEVNKSSLNKRGWTFQERALSRRLLHFGKSVFWECNTILASEFHPVGQGYKRDPRFRFDGSRYTATEMRSRQNMSREWKTTGAFYTRGVRMKFSKPWRKWFKKNDEYRSPEEVEAIWRDSRFGFRGSLETLLNLHGSIATADDTVSRFETNRRWFELVSMYSERHLTRPTDCLIAIAGIAQKISDGGGLQYRAGIWAENSIFNLLWKAGNNSRARPTRYRAPSWSWASVDSNISHLLLPDTSQGTSQAEASGQNPAHWRLRGIAAQVLTFNAFLEKAPTSLNSVVFDVYSISLSTMLEEVDIEKGGLYKKGNFHGQFFPDSQEDRDYAGSAYLALLCSYTTTKDYLGLCIHGLVLKSVSPPRLPENLQSHPTFERIGCFQILGNWAVFSGASKTVIVL